MKPGPPPDLGRWRQIEPILDQALELPGPERGSLLAVACAGDPGLRAEVEALLAADAAAGGFLGLPASEYAPDLLVEAAGEAEGEEDLAGRQVGPYRLLREIGSGGAAMARLGTDRSCFSASALWSPWSPRLRAKRATSFRDSYRSIR